MQAFDIVINGGGIVGLALACGLQGSTLRVAIIEHYALDPSRRPPVVAGFCHQRRQPAAVAICAGLGRHHRGTGQSLLRHGSLGAGQFWPYLLRWRRAGELAEVTLLMPASLR